ncbi:protein roadkill [Caerostris darwini]|uniref:Protein roadkill n=1 Tax=Caerostris darwini TaxID=1538125 RepID=A0AAV4RL98_9ARAC|nr:protein roadkill [Caerostris darwini]
MAFNIMRQDGSFTFTWTLKDIDFCFSNRNYVRSPTFSAESLRGTIWGLYLHGSSESLLYDSLRLTLKRGDNLPFKITIGVSLSMEMPDGWHEKVDETKTHEFLNGTTKTFELMQTFDSLRPKMSDNKLKIKCQIWDLFKMSKFSEGFSAISHLGVESVSCLWKIKSFSKSPTLISSYPLLPDTSHKLKMQGISWKFGYVQSIAKTTYLNIQIIQDSVSINSSVHVAGRISIIGNGNKEIITSESRHVFGSNGENKTWNFPMPVSQDSKVLKRMLFLGSDELSLLCEFYFSILINESMEYRMLPAEYQNICHDATDETLLRVRFPSIEIDKSSEAVYGSEMFTIDKPETSHEGCLDSLVEDLKNLYTKKNYCDVVLRADGLSFPAHKRILCSRSPIFRAMFNASLSVPVKEEIDIIGMHPVTLNKFLLFLYSAKLDHLEWDEAIQLLYAAKKYQVPSLQVECCTFMKSHLSISNVCEAFDEAFKYQSTELKTACEEFTIKNAVKVFASKEWKEFSEKYSHFSSQMMQRFFSLMSSKLLNNKSVDF